MTDTKATVPLIYAKIAAVREKAPTLQKNGTGPSTQGGYKFLSIDDILTAIRPLEVEQGIISFPVASDLIVHHNTAQVKDDGRKPSESTQVFEKYVFRYLAVGDGTYIDVPVTGEAIDTSDKAVRKATTQAQKIANILIYNLITGDPDPDGQDGNADSNKASAPTPATSKALDAAKKAPAKPATPAKAPAKVPAAGPSKRDKVRVEYIEAGLVTKDEANNSKNAHEAKGLKGDDLWDAVYKDMATVVKNRGADEPAF